MTCQLSIFGANAVAYCERGIAVFPLRPRTKAPYGGTTGFKGASADPALAIERWSGRAWLPLKEPEPGEAPPRPAKAQPSSNIGIATGAISGFWALDLDGEDAEKALADLVAVHGPLPPTVEQSTGKGRHLCFAWDPARPVRNTAKKIGPGVDVRGDGGYVVAPPSIHPGDPKKGIPPGRVYAWTEGRSPFELDFARAPEWLMKLAAPAPEPAPATPVQPSKPRRAHAEGNATRYGEAALNGACRSLELTAKGGQNNAIFVNASAIGQLVAGGEIFSQSYALEALRRAGEAMVAGAGNRWTKREEDTLQRGFRAGMAEPRQAPERPSFAPVGERKAEAPTPAEQAAEIRDARSLWHAARPADCGAVRSWLKHRGLDPHGIPGAIDRLRAHAEAPVAPGRRSGAVLAPLVVDPDGEVDALAILPLDPPAEGFAGFLGAASGRVVVLARPAPETLVAQTLQDAWALGQNAFENGHALGVVIAPTPQVFAGGALGDRYGRVDPQIPHADPDASPWTAEGVKTVFLAVRDDNSTPELKSRRAFGTTARASLTGEAAARFYGGLAEQAWRRAGASAARILRPSGGRAGFNDRGF